MPAKLARRGRPWARAPRSRSSGTGRSASVRWCVRAMSHCGQRTTWPQAGHWMCVEKPAPVQAAESPARPSSSAWRMAACSCRLIAPRESPRVLVAAQVDRAHRRQRPVQHPPRHLDQRVLAGLRPVPALQRRRGRAEHQRHPFGLGPGQGHVAGVIARGALLLERRLRAPRPARSAPGAAWGRRPRCGRRRPPAPAPSAIRCQCQCRSASLRWLCSTATRVEPRAEPLDRLRREADLRHQHDRLPAETDHLAGSPGCRPRSCRCRSRRGPGSSGARGSSGRRGSRRRAVCWSGLSTKVLLPRDGRRGLRLLATPARCRARISPLRRSASIGALRSTRPPGPVRCDGMRLGRGGQDLQHLRPGPWAASTRRAGRPPPGRCSSSVASRVPAWTRTPAGTTASSTCPQGQR